MTIPLSSLEVQRRGIRRAAAGGVSMLVAALLLPLQGGTVEETFETDPFPRGWRLLGEGAPAVWDADSGRVRFEWDSSKPNAFFARPLGVELRRSDDFEFGFDLELTTHAVGTTASKPGTFPIAVGLIRMEEAVEGTFLRGTGTSTPDLVEWAWFGADATISASISPVMTSTNRPPRWAFRDSYVELTTGHVYQVEARYTATDSTLRFTLRVDGEPGPDIRPVVLPSTFTDFRVDAISFTSYSDAGQDPRYAGSVKATAWVDAVRWVTPDVPRPQLQLMVGSDPKQLQCLTQVGWFYQLEASTDLMTWGPVDVPVAGTGGAVVFTDLREALFLNQFYRVKVVRE